MGPLDAITGSFGVGNSINGLVSNSRQAVRTGKTGELRHSVWLTAGLIGIVAGIAGLFTHSWIPLLLGIGSSVLWVGLHESEMRLA